jgi:hypothetical protein
MMAEAQPRIPVREITVGAVKYKLREQPRIYNGEGRQLYGEADHVNLVIRIDPDMPLVRNKQTLVHEWLHCLDVEYHVGIDNEDLVERLGHALFAALRDNPDLVKFITGD